MLELITYIGITLLATAIVWGGSILLESSSERLAVHYELPSVVTGAVILAIGSSFPELSAAILSTWLHGEFELGVATIVGSAIFNILVIPGACGLVISGDRGLEANRDLIYKEAQFYIIAVAVLLLTFSFAVIYAPIPAPEAEAAILGELGRPLMLFPISLYGLYLFLQYQDTVDFESSYSESEVAVGKEWLRLVGGLFLILVGVEGLVRSALGLGEYFDTPAFFWGVSIVAVATSMPDAFVSVQATRKGNTDIAVANVLGSNVFDLLICIPAGVLVAGSAVVNYSVAAPMMAALTVATIFLFTAMRTQMSISRGEAVFLLIAYLVFCGWMAAESFEWLDWLPGLPPEREA